MTKHLLCEVLAKKMWVYPPPLQPLRLHRPFDFLLCWTSSQSCWSLNFPLLFGVFSLSFVPSDLDFRKIVVVNISDYLRCSEEPQW